MVAPAPQGVPPTVLPTNITDGPLAPPSRVALTCQTSMQHCGSVPCRRGQSGAYQSAQAFLDALVTGVIAHSRDESIPDNMYLAGV